MSDAAPDVASHDHHDLPLDGIEPDNLLGFLSVLGLLRALEHARPMWKARVWWEAPVFRAQLRLPVGINRDEVAGAAAEACADIGKHFDVDGRANVKFEVQEYRAYVTRVAGDPLALALAGALTAEHPEKRSGGLPAAPLVMLFGQGHQNFLDRIVRVSQGALPTKMHKLKAPPDLASPTKIAEALFAPWTRTDDAEAFRWDPAEDQRYALRFDDPSAAGAAPTVQGANRLATLGLLSYGCAPAQRRHRVPGVTRDEEGVSFVWPLWTKPLSRRGIESLLGHPDVVGGQLSRVRPLGVLEIIHARRISNGKFMNIVRGSPWRQPSEAG